MDGVSITYWYKNIDEVVVHRMKTEMNYQRKVSFMHNGYTSANIIFGADHGACQFCAVVHLIICSNCNKDVFPFSVFIIITNIDCGNIRKESCITSH